MSEAKQQFNIRGVRSQFPPFNSVGDLKDAPIRGGITAQGSSLLQHVAIELISLCPSTLLPVLKNCRLRLRKLQLGVNGIEEAVDQTLGVCWVYIAEAEYRDDALAGIHRRSDRLFASYPHKGIHARNLGSIQ